MMGKRRMKRRMYVAIMALCGAMTVTSVNQISCKVSGRPGLLLTVMFVFDSDSQLRTIIMSVNLK